MLWMYAGFLAAIYLAIGIMSLFVLPGHNNPPLGVLAIFLFIPGLLLGFSFEAVVTAVDEQRALRQAIRNGRLSRKHAWWSGVVAGAIAAVCVSILWLGIALIFNSMAGIVAGVLITVLMLAFFPYLAVAYLMDQLKVDESDT